MPASSEHLPLKFQMEHLLALIEGEADLESLWAQQDRALGEEADAALCEDVTSARQKLPTRPSPDAPKAHHADYYNGMVKYHADRAAKWHEQHSNALSKGKIGKANKYLYRMSAHMHKANTFRRHASDVTPQHTSSPESGQSPKIKAHLRKRTAQQAASSIRPMGGEDPEDTNAVPTLAAHQPGEKFRRRFLANAPPSAKVSAATKPPALPAAGHKEVTAKTAAIRPAARPSPAEPKIVKPAARSHDRDDTPSVPGKVPHKAVTWLKNKLGSFKKNG